MIKNFNQHNKGALLVLVLVFGTIFFLIVMSFMGFVVTQSQIQENKLQQERALAIAEAGLDYYKWFLAHYPSDVTNGTGLPGPYDIPYSDPELGVIGTSSLSIASSTYCGVVSNIEIYSTGYTAEKPNLTRTVYGRYSRPTVAEYAYIINSNVWAGPDRTIIGPYHSNGVIRMDGTNNSTVTSGQEDWVCDGSINCGASGVTLDAVFGDGPNFALWNFPSTPINFTGLTLDLAVMKDRAENGGGISIPPTASNDYGYRLDFQNDGTLDVYTVDTVYSYYSYNSEDGDGSERNVIDDDNFYATYTLNPDCPLVFVEDKVWLGGDLSMKVTVAAADTDTAGVDPSIILNDNITYATSSAGLLAVAEDDVLVGLVVPDNMILNGIFVAQNGRFGRNHYRTSGSYDVLSIHDSYVKRNSLTINGTIVSNGRVGTKWVNGFGNFTSGFDTRYNSYDRNLVDDPPPLAPHTSDDYRFIEWREEI
ncbi:hypothetical protein KC845_00335 [Candidatus Kaiserbacteria bacterium]|nr:hypothetical protein [Candidatus Kaiserbacteria bacterium]